MSEPKCAGFEVLRGRHRLNHGSRLPLGSLCPGNLGLRVSRLGHLRHVLHGAYETFDDDLAFKFGGGYRPGLHMQHDAPLSPRAPGRMLVLST